MKHIGLVLSGGMGKGAYQVGSLLALSKYFKPEEFDYVSSSSVGVLNTYAYLTHNLDSLKSMWENANIDGDKHFITSVLKSNFLQEKIEELAIGEKLENTFYIALLDLKNRELNYKNISDVQGDKVKSYLKASVAMPFYNDGVEIDDRVYYDGAVADNIPIAPLVDKSLDYIICIYFDDFDYVFEGYDMDDKIIRLTFPEKKRVSPSVYITQESVNRMLEEGYRRTEQILDEIFADGTEDVEKVVENNRHRNSAIPDRVVRITGDVVVTNMNKLVRKMVKRTKISDV